ncbi:SCP2 sterol-binding domain-containing protein [Bdellovibrionota bacterium]
MINNISEVVEGYIPQNIHKAKDQLSNQKFTIGFSASGEGGGEWTLKFKEGDVEVSREKPSTPDCQLEASAETWLDLFNGRMNYLKALLLGKLKVRGNKTLALKITTSILS